MNRFAATGLFIEAAKGQRILVITPRRHEIGDALDCFMRIEDVATWPGVRARRANGDERIDLTGRGRIVFHSASSSLSGQSADIVFIDDEADRRLSDTDRDRLYMRLRHVVAGSSTGEIVRS
ncbi:hypothetical protein QE375_001604 [Microbacterium foliorum]|uniref:Uncharacterized protein n=1 Tax=Microbacterium foliorum TaxID=104336 RepID=A0ABU1HSJ1_9MICO|nr:hypothetical protein [Microbacterium foliorum]MDR6142050.1 hypothetical protein [Microbacterium foliorum]